jgi:hypothetical protein
MRADVLSVPMSYYTYIPQTVADERRIWLMPSEQFLDADLVENLMAKTPNGQELAVHSDMRLESGEARHLVMVDMSTASRAHLEKLREFLGDNFFQKISWYSSGRSFHGYGEDLLSQEDWIRFMGLLLLANKPRLEATVDPRWIGHRLLAGHAALRWTKNTSHYILAPAAIDSQARPKAPHSDVAPVGRSFHQRGR